MTVRLGSNIASLRAQRHFSTGTLAVSQSYERLSSGMRLNRASDDAAGLAVASSLSASSRVFTQGLKNINDGLSFLNIAQGALNELTTITDRHMELAEQAANGVYSTKQRQALQQEADALSEEYNRIVASTTFNGRRIFTENSREELRIQLEYGVEGGIGMSIGSSLSRAVGTGTFAARVTYATGATPDSVTLGDFNGDGTSDMAVGHDGSGIIGIYVGNGDGTFKNRINYNTTGGSDYLNSADINGDGQLDLVNKNWTTSAYSVLLGNGDGSFKAHVTYATAGDGHRFSLEDINGDGALDLFGIADSTSGSLNVLLGNGNGSFKAFVSYYAGATVDDMATGDLNGDGRVDVVIADGIGNVQQVLLSNGDGSFRAPVSYRVNAVSSPDFGNLTLADFDRDGALDMLSVADNGVVNILRGNGDGTFKARRTFSGGSAVTSATATDLNGDGFLDIAIADDSGDSLNIMLGNGDGSFTAFRSHAAGSGLMAMDLGDINKDGVSDIVLTDTSGMRAEVFLAVTTTSPSIGKLNLTSQKEARAALDTIRSTKEQISLELGAIGATESRLRVAMRNLETARENYTASVSRITDADIAQETASLTRNNIVQQAAASILAQANSAPEIALSLLRA